MTPFSKGFNFPYFEPINFQSFMPSGYDSAFNDHEAILKCLDYCSTMGLLNQQMSDNWNTVLGWIKTQGIDESVTAQLNAWIADGTMAEILNKTSLKEINDKLDKLQAQYGIDLANIREAFTNTINLMEKNLNNKIDSIVSGSPVDALPTLADIEAKYPTGTKGIVVAQDDGYWYYWYNNKWTKGDVYQNSADHKELERVKSLSILPKDSYEHMAVNLNDIPLEAGTWWANITHAENTADPNVKFTNAPENLIWGSLQIFQWYLYGAKSFVCQEIITNTSSVGKNIWFSIREVSTNKLLDGYDRIQLDMNDNLPMPGEQKYNESFDFNNIPLKPGSFWYNITAGSHSQTVKFANAPQNLEWGSFQVYQWYMSNSNNYICQNIYSYDNQGNVKGVWFALREKATNNYLTKDNFMSFTIADDAILPQKEHATTYPFDFNDVPLKPGTWWYNITRAENTADPNKHYTNAPDNFIFGSFQVMQWYLDSNKGWICQMVFTGNENDAYRAGIYYKLRNAKTGVDLKPYVRIKFDNYASRNKLFTAGDSRTAGYLPGGGYAKFTWPIVAADILNMQLTDSAVSGSGWQWEKGGSSGYLTATTNSFVGVNLAVFAYGINDYQQNAPLGTIDDPVITTGKPTTVASAIKSSIEAIYRSNQLVELVLVTAFPSTKDGDKDSFYSYNHKNTAGYTLNELNDMIVAIAKSYGVSYIDVREGFPINKENITTFLTDGLHPHNDDNYINIGQYMGAKLSAIYKAW